MTLDELRRRLGISAEPARSSFGGIVPPVEGFKVGPVAPLTFEERARAEAEEFARLARGGADYGGMDELRRILPRRGSR